MTIQALKERLQVHDRRRRVFLEELAGLPPDLLFIKPDPKRWSLIEVLHHLVLSEREVLRGLPDPSELTHRPAGLRNRLGYILALGVLKWHVPVPVPSPSMLPEGNLELDELRRRWDENMDWLSGYLDPLKDDDIDVAVFRHPVAGPLNAVQALRLARLHLETHLRQVKRILKDIPVELHSPGKIIQRL